MIADYQTYEQKNRLVLIAMVSLLIAGILLAVIPGIGLFISNQALKGQISELNSADLRLSSLNSQLMVMEANMGYIASSRLESKGTLMEYASNYCTKHPCRIVEMPKTSFQEQEGITFENNTLSVSGNFKDVLGLVYLIEHKHRLSRTSSLSFEMILDRRTRKEHLVATAHFQNILSNANN